VGEEGADLMWCHQFHVHVLRPPLRLWGWQPGPVRLRLRISTFRSGSHLDARQEVMRQVPHHPPHHHLLLLSPLRPAHRRALSPCRGRESWIDNLLVRNHQNDFGGLASRHGKFSPLHRHCSLIVKHPAYFRCQTNKRQCHACPTHCATYSTPYRGTMIALTYGGFRDSLSCGGVKVVTYGGLRPPPVVEGDGASRRRFCRGRGPRRG